LSSFADELVGRKPFEGLEATGKVTGGGELIQMKPEMVMRFVIM